MAALYDLTHQLTDQASPIPRVLPDPPRGTVRWDRFEWLLTCGIAHRSEAGTGDKRVSQPSQTPGLEATSMTPMPGRTPTLAEHGRPDAVS